MPADVGLVVRTSRRLPFPEVAALFNPALVATLIYAAAEGFGEDNEHQGLPWLAAFLVLPFAIHDQTRLSLPRDIRTSVSAWAVQNPLLKDQFGTHANSMAPATRAGIRCALRTGVLRLTSTNLTPAGQIRGITGKRGANIRPYYAAGRLVGRWVARTDVLTTYSILGVTP
jgi:hypothetical protein